MVDEVCGPLDASHLREGEDVGHAGADARVKGTPEVDLTVGAQKGVAEIDPCHAAAVADSQQLPIGQIARLRAQRMGVGMGGDQR